MNLYLLSQTVNIDWDTYDSCVVAARGPKSAVKFHPNGGLASEDVDMRYSTWCHIKDVKVVLIGKAHKSIKEGVVLASFNAG
jgi:hypothetical protein